MTSAAHHRTARARLPRLLAALVAACLALTGLTMQPAQAADTGSITGKIFTKAVGGSAKPATNPYLYVYYSSTRDGHYESLDSNPSTEGTDAFRFPGSAFALTGLKAGFYKFEVGGVDGDAYLREYYNDAGSLGDATPVQVGTGATAVADTVLEPAGQITGRVTDTSGKPLAGASVSFLKTEQGGSEGVVTDANGYYTTTTTFREGLVQGAYRVAAQHHGSGDAPSHLEEYWKDATTYGSAAPVTVTPGATIGSINFTLAVAPRVTLTVTDPTGKPLVKHPVGIYVKAADGSYESIQSGPWETDSAGVLRKEARLGDGYKFVVDPPSGMTGAVTEWYDNAYTQATAAPVVIATQSQQIAIKLQLGPAPVVTGSTPTIAGAPVVGQTLTATPGTWGPTGVQLAYQWYAGSDPIAGATAKTFALTSSQTGKPITVKVTGTLAGHTTTSKTSAATAAVTLPLVTGSTPTITGTPQVGKTLTAAPGTWGPTGVLLAYQWYAGGTAVGTNAATYVPTATDVGKTITVKVTGTKAGHTTTSKTSAATAAVALQAMIPGTPTIAGVATAGKTLTATPGAWTPSGVQWGYQWLANGVAIPNATGTTFKLTNTQAGKLVTVRVTGTLTGWVPAAKESAATAAVRGVLTARQVSISGTRKVGKKLRADTHSWGPAPVKMTYRWYRNGRAIAGQKTRYYRLRNADKGKRISVRIYQSKTYYTTISRLSPRTGTIKKR